MNHRGFGRPSYNGLFPFVLGGVVGSLLTNNRNQYYYPYQPYYYPYYPYTVYYR